LWNVAWHRNCSVAFAKAKQIVLWKNSINQLCFSWNELLQTFGVASDMNYTAPLCFHSCYILQCLAMCNCVDPDSITYSSINEYFVSIGKRLTVGACDATDQITWKCMHKVRSYREGYMSTFHMLQNEAIQFPSKGTW
jgi:hypothetical protein